MTTPAPLPFPDHGNGSDSLDTQTIYVDGPSDPTGGPLPPALQELLEADHETIALWNARAKQWLEELRARRRPEQQPEGPGPAA